MAKKKILVVAVCRRADVAAANRRLENIGYGPGSFAREIDRTNGPGEWYVAKIPVELDDIRAVCRIINVGASVLVWVYARRDVRNRFLRSLADRMDTDTFLSPQLTIGPDARRWRSNLRGAGYVIRKKTS